MPPPPPAKQQPATRKQQQPAPRELSFAAATQKQAPPPPPGGVGLALLGGLVGVAAGVAAGAWIMHAGTDPTPEKREAACTVCLDRAATHAFVPCGHQSACSTCAATVASSYQHARSPVCPICRTALAAPFVMKIYRA